MKSLSTNNLLASPSSKINGTVKHEETAATFESVK